MKTTSEKLDYLIEKLARKDVGFACLCLGECDCPKFMPIRIGDVLAKMSTKATDDFDYMIDCRGVFCKRYFEKHESGEDGVYPLGVGVRWNMKSDLTQQSEEVINFLYELFNQD